MEHNIDYSKETFTKCWTCRNACGGCSWSREFKPVKGWDAVKTYLPTNGEHAESYHVINCPEYKPDRMR
jgi:hypothetical protein